MSTHDKKGESFPTLRKLRADNQGTQLASELASILGMVDYGELSAVEPQEWQRLVEAAREEGFQAGRLAAASSERRTSNPNRLCLDGKDHGERYRYNMDGAEVCVKCLAIAAWSAPSAKPTSNSNDDA